MCFCSMLLDYAFGVRLRRALFGMQRSNVSSAGCTENPLLVRARLTRRKGNSRLGARFMLRKRVPPGVSRRRPGRKKVRMCCGLCPAFGSCATHLANFLESPRCRFFVLSLQLAHFTLQGSGGSLDIAHVTFMPYTLPRLPNGFVDFPSRCSEGPTKLAMTSGNAAGLCLRP